MEGEGASVREIGRNKGYSAYFGSGKTSNGPTANPILYAGVGESTVYLLGV